MSETANNEGKKTTEWKALLATVLLGVGSAGGALLKSDAFSADSLAALLIGIVVSVAVAVGTYISGRSKVKAAALAPSSIAVNPPQPPVE
jgi:hypothetical protein